MSNARAPADPGPRYHVVLVGIDFYHGGLDPLGACVNDVDAIQDVLIRRLQVPTEAIRRFAAPLSDGTARPETVPTEAPTRANLIAALTALGDAAKPGDRVFFYYAGHGTQVYVDSPGDGARYYRQALVPTDAKTWNPEKGRDEYRYIYDWELDHLLARIAARTPAMTVVLDCCCAAGATRELPDPRARVRFVASPQPVALPEEITPPPAKDTPGVARGLATAADFMTVAACLDDEVARESLDPGASGPGARSHGELTRALLERLDQFGDAELSDLRWGQIWRAVVAGVEARAPHQHPWLSSGLARRVFAGPPEEGDLGYAVTLDEATATYHLDAGSLVGVTPGAVVALYPPLGAPPAPLVFPPVGAREDLGARLGLLRVTWADRATATAAADPAHWPPPKLPPGTRGRLIGAGDDAKLAVALAPPDPAMARRLAQSPLLEVVKEARVTLVQRSDRSWAITDGFFGTGEEPAPRMPTLPFLPDATPAPGARDIAVDLVEHYYWYDAPLRMARRCTDLPDRLVVRLLDCNGLSVPVSPEKAMELPQLQPLASIVDVKAGRYDDVTSTWISTGDALAIRVDNTADVDLWVTLFNCDSDGLVRIYASRGFLRAKSSAIFWAYRADLGTPIGAFVSAPQSVALDHYVAIATTNAQASLEYLALETTFAQVANGGGARPAAPVGTQERWTATTVNVRMTLR